MSRVVLIALFFSLCLLGCSSTTNPLAWKSDDVDFSEFQYFDIQPVSNATGHAVMQDILTFLTDGLKQQFLARNLQLVDDRQTENQVLVVQSEMLKYKFQFFTGPPPPSRDIIGLCILRTHLIQKTTGLIVGKIITSNRVDVGRGMLEPKNPDSLLRESTNQIAREVVRMRE